MRPARGPTRAIPAAASRARGTSITSARWRHTPSRGSACARRTAIRAPRHCAPRALALREAGWTLAKIGDALGLSQGQAHLLVRKAERLAYRPHWADGMPMRAQNFLRNREVYGLSEIEAARTVAQLSDREIMATPNVGKGACVALVAWLARHGLRLQPEISLKAARVSARSVPSTTIHPEKNSAATRQELAAEEGESKAWPLDTIQPLDATPR